MGRASGATAIAAERSRSYRPAMSRIPRITHRISALAAAAFLALGTPAGAEAAQSAVLFVYHRFGESEFPTTSLRLDQFEAEIAELKNGGYTVMAIPEILRAIRDGRELPELTVGISVDDAYLSAYAEAWPRLKKAGFPMTVFVATDPVDRGFRDYMNWDQIRRLAKEGVTIGAHSASHLHMADAAPDKNADEIARSNARFKAELGAVPEIFAYPYGETSLAVREQVKAAGYAFAFGQHSGVIYPGSDFFNLPRFAINEHFAAPSEFRNKARSLPLAVKDLAPADPLLMASPAAISFTVEETAALDRLTCFDAEGAALPFTKTGGNRIEVKIAKTLPPGRFRLSCTLPAGDGRFRWFGAPYYLPKR